MERIWKKLSVSPERKSPISIPSLLSDLLLVGLGEPESVGELGCAFSMSSEVVDSMPLLFDLASGEYCSTNSNRLFSSTRRECLLVMNSRVLRGSTPSSCCECSAGGCSMVLLLQ